MEYHFSEPRDDRGNKLLIVPIHIPIPAPRSPNTHLRINRYIIRSSCTWPFESFLFLRPGILQRWNSSLSALSACCSLWTWSQLNLLSFQAKGTQVQLHLQSYNGYCARLNLILNTVEFLLFISFIVRMDILVFSLRLGKALLAEPLGPQTGKEARKWPCTGWFFLTLCFA